MPWRGPLLALAMVGTVLLVVAGQRARAARPGGGAARPVRWDWLAPAALWAAPLLALGAAGAAAWRGPAAPTHDLPPASDQHHEASHPAGPSSPAGVPVTASAEPDSRIPVEELAALEALSGSRPPLDHVPVDHGHGHDGDGGHGHGLADHGHDGDGVAPAHELDPARQAVLDRQWAVAQEVSRRLGSIDAARAAGYVQAGAAVPGVGEHWIKWSLVDRPFDPATPSMLLYQQMGDSGPKRLVGLSYWAASAVEPAGFAGEEDRWHRHFGLCFHNGWLMAEGIADPHHCDGYWVNGSDLWMLHAWTVPEVANAAGRFAETNRRLCPSPRGRPDLVTCDPIMS